MICDTLQHLDRYRGFHKNLDTAIDYLAAYTTAHALADLPLGRTEVDGDNVFINVMDAELHDDADSHPEYHHLYADLQIDLAGGEGWGYETQPGVERGDSPATSASGTARTRCGAAWAKGVSSSSSPASSTSPAWPGSDAARYAKRSSRSRWRTKHDGQGKTV